MNKLGNLKYIALVLCVSGCMGSAVSLTKKADKKKGSGAYPQAAELYKLALEKGGNTSYINAQIGEVYRLSNKAKEAAPYYKAAIDAGNKADSIQFQYGFALKSLGKYEEASEQFANYAKVGAKQALVKRAKAEVENLKKVSEIAAKTTPYVINNFSSLNTSASENSPFIQGNELIFASSRGDGKIYSQTGTPYLSLYKVNIEGAVADSTNAVKPFSDKINTPNRHEANATISKDGSTLVFARSNTGSKKGLKEVGLFISYLRNGEWTEPELLPFSSPDYWNGSPAFSPDGKALYFASNRGGGKGGLDLYKATTDNTGRWNKVTNLGEPINTVGDEIFPYVSDEGKLYFSSDGHPGLGALDLFVAVRDKNNKVTVENMGVPINSNADDFGISFKTPLEGFFTSNREGGKGDDDIYKFVNEKNVLKTVVFTLSGKVLEKDEKGTESILPNAHIKLLDNTGKVLAETETSAEGKYSFNVPLLPSKDFVLMADKPDYLTKRENYSTHGKQPPQEELKAKETTIPLEHNLVLDKIKIEKVIALDNIYYDFNKADIRPDAAIELDKLVQVLQDNPKISIELSSHTDSRGNDEYNEKLSQRRAESAVQYIISKGVDATRIVAKGYGESKPIIENATTEEEFQKNRRTEFKVTKYEK